MLEKPNLPDNLLLQRLRDDYGVTAAELTFLPIGYDYRSSVYRVRADDGRTYFLKARRGAFDAAAVAVPRFLHDRDILQVVASLPTRDGAMWTRANDEFSLILYPFIESETAMQRGMTAAQWTTFGATLRAIHDTALPDDLAALVGRETFTFPEIALARKIDAHLTSGLPLPDDTARALAAEWRTRRDEILHLAARAETLGDRLRDDPPPFVLCHTDIHTANILLDENGGLHIVDWDAPLLAPKERDLMFVGVSIGDDKRADSEVYSFFAGYGETTLNPLALAYYRVAWAVTDIAQFADCVLLSPDAGAETRTDALRWFLAQFAPNGSVDDARAADIV